MWLILCERKDHREDEQNGKHDEKDLQHPVRFFFLIRTRFDWLNVFGFFICHSSLDTCMFLKGGCHSLFEFLESHRFHDIRICTELESLVYGAVCAF